MTKEYSNYSWIKYMTFNEMLDFLYTYRNGISPIVCRKECKGDCRPCIEAWLTETHKEV